MRYYANDSLGLQIRMEKLNLYKLINQIYTSIVDHANNNIINYTFSENQLIASRWSWN